MGEPSWLTQLTVDIKNSPEGSVKRRLPNVSKIKRALGWEAKVELEDGLRKMIEWYIENPKPTEKKK